MAQSTHTSDAVQADLTKITVSKSQDYRQFFVDLAQEKHPELQHYEFSREASSGEIDELRDIIKEAYRGLPGTDRQQERAQRIFNLCTETAYILDEYYLNRNAESFTSILSLYEIFLDLAREAHAMGVKKLDERAFNINRLDFICNKMNEQYGQDSLPSQEFLEASLALAGSTEGLIYDRFFALIPPLALSYLDRGRVEEAEACADFMLEIIDRVESGTKKIALRETALLNGSKREAERLRSYKRYGFYACAQSYEQSARYFEAIECYDRVFENMSVRDYSTERNSRPNWEGYNLNYAEMLIKRASVKTLAGDSDGADDDGRSAMSLLRQCTGRKGERLDTAVRMAKELIRYNIDDYNPDDPDNNNGTSLVPA